MTTPTKLNERNAAEEPARRLPRFGDILVSC